MFLPQGTGVRELARVGMAPGLMSAGLGAVPAEQTYLDITQGNRVFDSLYDAPLRPRVELLPGWKRLAEGRNRRPLRSFPPSLLKP